MDYVQSIPELFPYTLLVTDADNQGHWVMIDNKPILIMPGNAGAISSRQMHSIAYDTGVGHLGKRMLMHAYMSKRIQTRRHAVHTIALAKAYQKTGHGEQEAFQRALEHRTIAGAVSHANEGDTAAHAALEHVQTGNKGQEQTKLKVSPSAMVHGKKEDIVKAVTSLLRDNSRPSTYDQLVKQLDGKGIKLSGSTGDQARLLRRILSSHVKTDDKLEVIGNQVKIKGWGLGPGGAKPVKPRPPDESKPLTPGRPKNSHEALKLAKSILAERDKAIQDIQDEYERLNEEYTQFVQNGGNYQSPEGRAIIAKREQTWNDRTTVTKHYTQRLHEEVIYVNPSERTSLEVGTIMRGFNIVRGNTQTNEVKNIVKDGFEAFGKMTTIPLNPAGTNVLRLNAYNREYHVPGSVAISKTTPTHTVIHELGHELESWDQNANARAHRFLSRRTRGEKAVKLRILSPGSAYESHEVAKPDKFLRPYIGKIYGNNTIFDGTEIHAMGMEMLYANPREVIEKDPDFFHFLYESCRGREYNPDDNNE